jgi:hypothetical protein
VETTIMVFAVLAVLPAAEQWFQASQEVIWWRTNRPDKSRSRIANSMEDQLLIFAASSTTLQRVCDDLQ